MIADALPPHTRQPGRVLALVGSWLQLAPVLGMAGTVVGMIRAFHSISEGASAGIADPSHLSAAIGEVLITTFVGMLVALVGAVLMLVAVLKSRYRGEWLFWLLVILGFLYIFAFPLGTLIGIAFLVVALPRRAEFLRPQQRSMT